MALQPAQQRAFAKRPVRDHRDAALAGERQDALLDLAIEQVVGDLHEIERWRRMTSSISRWRRPSDVVMPT
jgi:hypothetical protein